MVPPPADEPGTDALDRALLDRFQRGFPLQSRPFAVLGDCLGISEAEVIARLTRLRAAGMVGRVGAVIAPRRAGASTLAAMCVPEARLDEVAAIVSRHPAVNHNYSREHAFNLWFVVTATDAAAVQAALDDIGRESGIVPLDLPLVEAFHIDLGFPLRWN
ncbi:MAG: AsnC family transcriptional regulator [Acetobacteraceae bacterium]|nr:AsnC family transcriptional regulator [Acetobacteraceae bacterium]